MVMIAISIAISIVSSVSGSFVDDQYKKFSPNYEPFFGVYNLGLNSVSLFTRVYCADSKKNLIDSSERDNTHAHTILLDFAYR